MVNKIMQVFYGTDCLPYKDKARSVHYPIVGNSFLGASNTTQIRFYIEQIGDRTDTWVANSKLPNGKIGNKVLTTYYDEEVEEYYALLELSSFYTQAKGDLYISLNGFYGGVEITYDENTDQYSIEGIPTIQATGVVKIMIAYATPLQDGEEEQVLTLQQLLAEIGKKLNKDDNKYLKVVLSTISSINNPTYEAYLKGGDVVYSSVDKKFYILSGTYPSLTATEIALSITSATFTNLYVSNIHINSFDNITNEDNVSLTQYIANQISGASDTYVTLTTEQTISGHKTFTTTISANQGVNFGNGANLNMYNGYIQNNRAKLFSIGTSADNRTFYQFPYGAVSGSTHGESNPYTIATEDYVQTYVSGYAYSKEEINQKLTSMLVYKGTQTVAQLNALAPSLTSANTGWFYNVSDSGTLSWTSGGSTQTIEVLAGDNICWTGSGWDKLTMDLSAYDDKFIAAGFFEVQAYNENTGEITFVYASDLYSMSYNTNTGILTIEAN